MLLKTPRNRWSRLLWKGGKIAIAAEVVSICVSYLGWKQLGKDQDLRYYMYKNYNWVLEGYYRVDEKLALVSEIRERDLTAWAAAGKQL